MEKLKAVDDNYILYSVQGSVIVSKNLQYSLAIKVLGT